MVGAIFWEDLGSQLVFGVACFAFNIKPADRNARQMALILLLPKQINPFSDLHKKLDFWVPAFFFAVWIAKRKALLWQWW